MLGVDTVVRWSRALIPLGIGAACALVALPHPARAQGAGPTATEQAEPTPEAKAEAAKRFQEGRAAFAAKRFEDALSALRASYAAVHSPNSHLMIVHTLVELGRFPEAYEEARSVAAEAEAAAQDNPKYAKTAEAARQEVDRQRARIGLATVRVLEVQDRAKATLQVNGRTIEPEAWSQPVPVAPGPVEIKLTTPEGSAVRQVAVRAGGSVAVTLRVRGEAETGPAEPTGSPAPLLEPDEGPPTSTKRTLAYVGLAVGGAAMASFAIFGGLTLSEYGDLEERCPTNRCPDDEADTGRTYQAVANVSLVLGLVGLSAGAGLLVWDLVEPEGPDAGGDATASVTVAPGALVVRGTF